MRSGKAAASSRPGSPSAGAPDPHPPAILAGHATDARQCAPIGGGIAVGDRRQPQSDIRRRIGAAQWVALLQQRGEIGGERCLAWRPRRQHHRRKPRMRAERGHPPPGVGDAPSGVERAKLGQQRGGGGERALRRRVVKRQIAGRRAPGGAVQCQARQLCLEDFRPVEGGQAAVQRRGPQPDRDARRLAARAAGPLLGRGARDPQRRQPGQPGRRDRAAAPGASRHRPRSARPARSARSRRSRSPAPPAAVSAGRSARSCSAGGRSPCSGSTSAPQPASAACGAADLRHAGQEGEDVAVVLRQRGAHGAGHRVGQVARAGNVARGVAGPRPGTSGRRFRSPPRPSGRPDARHRRSPTSRAAAVPAAARAAGRRHSASARSDSSERSCTSSRITAATPSSPGSDCSRRISRPSVITSMRVAAETARIEPGAVADRAADRLAEQGRHAGGRGAGGEPARLQHQDRAHRRATARRAGRAAPAWSCRRRAAPPARRCVHRRGSPAASGGRR